MKMSDNEVQSKESMLEALSDISETSMDDSTAGLKDINDVDLFSDDVAQSDLPEIAAKADDSEDVPPLEASGDTSEQDPFDEVDEEKVDEPKKELEQEDKKLSPIEGIDSIKDKTFKIKVDGKEIEINGAEMARRASGDIAVEKRFSELDIREKVLQDKVFSHEKTLESYKERFKSGDIYGALSEMFDTPAYLLKDKMISSLGPEFERRSQMTEDQLALQRKLEEGKYYKNSYESEIERRTEEQRQSAIAAEENALNQEIQEAREAHKMSLDEWDASFSELDKTLPQDQEITKEMVVDNFLSKQSNNGSDTSITNKVNSVLSKYEEHLNDNFRQQFTDFVKLTPDLTAEELDKIVKSSISKSMQEKLTGKPKSNNLNSREAFFDKQEQELLKDLMDSNADSDTNWF